MNKVNLLRLADILDAAHKRYEENETQNCWDSGYYQGHFVHTCGAPACAIGHWAANTPTWSIDTETGAIRRDDPELQDKDYYGALQDFDLTWTQASVLFEGNGCGRASDAHEAAEYIRDFVARDGVLTETELDRVSLI